jgi:hypothetical protein
VKPIASDTGNRKALRQPTNLTCIIKKNILRRRASRQARHGENIAA